MKIIRYSVKKLFKTYDHEIDLSSDDQIKIILGQNGRGGDFCALAISLAWSTVVGVLGYEEMRPWGSFFLQYLWEFCLGMWIAERCMKEDGRCWT